MSDSTTPKPGDTLTAAQANSLPVGSVVALQVDPKMTILRNKDGEWEWADESKWKGTPIGRRLTAKSYALLRVGPAVEQMDEPSDDRLADDLHDELLDEAVREGLVGNPMYVSAPAAFAVGDVVMREQLDALPIGAEILPCVCAEGQTYTKEAAGWRDWTTYKQHFSSSEFCSETFTITSLPSPTNPHAPGTLAWARWAAENEGVCIKCSHEQCKYPWRFKDGEWQFYRFGTHWYTALVGVGQTIESVLTGWSIVPDPSLPAETPETSDPAAIEPLHIDPAAIAEALDEALPKWREDFYPIHQAIRHLGYLAATSQQGERFQQSCIESLKQQVATLTAERDAAIQRAEKAEATERDWMSKGSQIDANMDDMRESIAGLEKERDELLGRCARAEARAVVPKVVRTWAEGLSRSTTDDRFGDVKAALFILSLTDHIVDANKMVQSIHSEGTRAWAEDAMRQGRGVTVNGDSVWYKKDTSFTKDEFRSQEGAWWQSDKMALTGWRIHTPAVAPATEPSVAQLQASIEAHEKRILALEGKG